MANEQSSKNPQKYICDICDYDTSSHKDFNKHLLTQKHKRLMETNENPQKSSKHKYLVVYVINNIFIWHHYVNIKKNVTILIVN